MDRKVGISVSPSMVTDERFESFQKNSIGSFELSVGHYTEPIDFFGTVRLAEKYGLECWSFHLPFYSHENNDPASLDKEVRDATVKFQGELIRQAAANGFKHIIIHPSCERHDDGDRAEALKSTKETMASLAEIADASGTVLCVEDLPRLCLGNCSDDILDILSAHPSLRCCFDTNHLLNEDITVFMDKVGEKIASLHVSDYDFVNERHWFPGEGKINWTAFMDKLDGIGYNGVFMYELGYNSKTIVRDKPWTPADVRKNADELFARKTLTKYGRVLENLGMWGPADK